MQKWRSWEAASDSEWGLALEREAVIGLLAEQGRLSVAAIDGRGRSPSAQPQRSLRASAPVQTTPPEVIAASVETGRRLPELSGALRYDGSAACQERNNRWRSRMRERSGKATMSRPAVSPGPNMLLPSF
jgi:hypothetical protein